MGFVGWMLALIGNFYVGRKVWWGFLVSVLANFFIGWNAYETRNPSLMTAVAVFVTMSIFNGMRWWRNPPEPVYGYDRWEVIILGLCLSALAASWLLFGVVIDRSSGAVFL